MDKILQYLITNDMLNLTDIKQRIEMNERKELLEKHTFKIWQGKNGIWYTYFPKGKGRVQKQRKTKEELEELVIEFYREQEENPSVSDVFYEWLNRKMENQEIEEATYTRYDVDFRRCFAEFGERKIKEIDEIEIEDFFKKCIRDKNMSRKAYSNIRTLVYGIFKYAKKKRLIDYSIKSVVDDIEFSKKEFSKAKHYGEEQIFFEEDENKVFFVMRQNLDILNLGIMLMFKTGLRVGELCTLKKTDIDGNIIHVRRTESIYKDRKTGEMIYGVKECPKTDAGIRDVILKNEYLWILKSIIKLNPFGKYLFENNGEHIRAYYFRKRLKINCDKAHIVAKSPHKVRKTYGTKLYDGNIPDSIICNQMGHTDISCLKKHYYFNINSKDEMMNKIESVENL